jgi:hypothetical protein
MFNLIDLARQPTPDKPSNNPCCIATWAMLNIYRLNYEPGQSGPMLENGLSVLRGYSKTVVVMDVITLTMENCFAIIRAKFAA